MSGPVLCSRVLKTRQIWFLLSETGKSEITEVILSVINNAKREAEELLVGYDVQLPGVGVSTHYLLQDLTDDWS